MLNQRITLKCGFINYNEFLAFGFDADFSLTIGEHLNREVSFLINITTFILNNVKINLWFIYGLLML